jgi:hypothetical protein
MTQRSARPALSGAKVARVFSAETFSVGIVEGIVNSVGLPLDRTRIDDLTFNLTEAVKGFVYDLAREAAEGRRSTFSRAEKIERLLSKALVECGIDGTSDPSNLFPSLAGGGLFAMAAVDGQASGEQAVNEALTAVVNLTRWAGMLRNYKTRQMERSTPTPRNAGSPAFASFLLRLDGIYFSFWNRIPARAHDKDGKEIGPFSRFLDAVHRHVAATVPGVRPRQAQALIARWRAAPEVMAKFRSNGR